MATRNKGDRKGGRTFVPQTGAGLLRGVQGVQLGGPDPLESRRSQERERARRMLIYADMIAKEDKIHWHRLHSWPYQPTEEDIDAALALMTRRGGKPRRGARPGGLGAVA